MSRRLTPRVHALETALRTDPTADLEAEAEQYGELLWGDAAGPRCYGRITPDGSELRILGLDGGPLIHQIDGIDWKDLQ